MIVERKYNLVELKDLINNIPDPYGDTKFVLEIEQKIYFITFKDLNQIITNMLKYSSYNILMKVDDVKNKGSIRYLQKQRKRSNK